MPDHENNLMAIQIPPPASVQNECADRQRVRGWEPREDAGVRDAEGRPDNVQGRDGLREVGLLEEFGGDDGHKGDFAEEREAWW